MITNAELKNLSKEEQVDLFERLMLVIHEDDAPLSEAERRDIDARLAAIQSNPNDKCSWDDFRRTLPHNS